MKKELPFVSIVIIAYNEERGIGYSLISLLNQNYPKDKYEIIVVDDCSKDKTVEIVGGFPVTLIQHKENLGRAQSRNTGLKYAKGKIYVSFDGDCIADKNWLKELINVYKTKKNVLGVGGEIKSDNPKNLTDRFIQENRYGNSVPLYVTESKNIFYRFFSYLKLESGSSNKKNKKHYWVSNVGEIMGANSSFYTRFLKEIGGWDANLNAREDNDICFRLKNKFKEKEIYVNKRAIIIHNHHLNLSDYIKNNFLRGIDLVKLYKKQNKFPPIFPFPLITLFLNLIVAFFNIRFLPLSLILLPLVLYFWWPIRFIKTSKFYFLVFSYIQLSLEMSTILGIIRGYIILKKSIIKN